MFENDIFISYAHIDDQALVEGQKGWISSFHRALEIRLAQLLGRQPRIWRDPKLQGNDVFSDRLLERLPQVALLVTIVSPRYVRSEWCMRELTEFFKATQASGGARVRDKIRIFKIVKTPVPLEQHPEALKEVLGYEFVSYDPETGRYRELSQTGDPELQRLYVDADYRGHGLGKLLAVHSEMHVRNQAVRHLWLRVWEGNIAAQEIYSRWGYSIVGKEQYQVGEETRSVILMIKSLSTEG